jgi:hypothetical protein
MYFLKRFRAYFGNDGFSAMYFLKCIRAYFGHDRFSSKTIDRLAYSMHVDDLRFIVNVTTIGTLIIIVIIGIITYTTYSSDHRKFYEILVPFQISAVVLGLGGIIAWCYQTGSARLGIVDLFSCEITTLCRICTISGLADTCISAVFELAPFKMREEFSHFESSEDYTPVFDANAKELQSLNVKVVINITAFYTYWKATRDAFRKLANTQARIGADPTSTDNEGWHHAMRNVLYMQFLACESARKAVRDLIEFQPNRAENTITILISELPLYGYLSRYFPEGDLRSERLELRRPRYQVIVPEVYYETVDNYAKCKAGTDELRRLARDDLDELRRDWDKAFKMLDELKSRYVKAIGEFPNRDTILP